MDFCQDQSRLPGCQTPVPPELEVERLCVLHFIQAVEQACTEMRREAARGWASPARQSVIANFIKTAATKLSRVTTGGLRLSDELKKTRSHRASDVDGPEREPRPLCKPLRARTAGSELVRSPHKHPQLCIFRANLRNQDALLAFRASLPNDLSPLLTLRILQIHPWFT